MVHQQCVLGNPMRVDLKLAVPSQGLVSLTSYQVCSGTASEEIVAMGEGSVRSDGLLDVTHNFTITEATNIAVGAEAGGSRRLNAAPPTYLFEDGGNLNGPWLFSVQT